MTNQIAKEIIELELDGLTLEQCWKLFTDIMLKYNIKQGELQEDGSELIDRYEWTCYKEVFISVIIRWFNIKNILNE